MRKKIYCKACHQEIGTIAAHGNPGYHPIAKDFIRVEAFHFNCDVDYPLAEFLPIGKGYEYYHYYHPKCFKHAIPGPTPTVIDLID